MHVRAPGQRVEGAQGAVGGVHAGREVEAEGSPEGVNPQRQGWAGRRGGGCKTLCGWVGKGTGSENRCQKKLELYEP